MKNKNKLKKEKKFYLTIKKIIPQAIAKGNGEKYWKCVFCEQKVATPPNNKKMKKGQRQT